MYNGGGDFAKRLNFFCSWYSTTVCILSASPQRWFHTWFLRRAQILHIRLLNLRDPYYFINHATYVNSQVCVDVHLPMRSGHVLSALRDRAKIQMRIEKSHDFLPCPSYYIVQSTKRIFAEPKGSSCPPGCFSSFRVGRGGWRCPTYAAYSLRLGPRQKRTSIHGMQ
jgi:hypothetical protein